MAALVPASWTHIISKSVLIGMCAFGSMWVAAGLLVPAKAVIAQILLKRAFASSLVHHRPEKPWPWADMAPAARLSVPRLNVDRIILDTGSGQAMAFGPTIVAGQRRAAGTQIIAAHRDTHFRFLGQLRRGDVVILTGLDGVSHRYAVTGSEIVRWDGFSVNATSSMREIALATCYPLSAAFHGPLRYVVHAREIQPQRMS